MVEPCARNVRNAIATARPPLAAERLFWCESTGNRMPKLLRDIRLEANGIVAPRLTASLEDSYSSNHVTTDYHTMTPQGRRRPSVS